MHENEHADEELAQLVADSEGEEAEAEMDEADWNAQTLSIRRADGEEVMTIVSRSEEWSTYMQPGGGVRNAFLGTPGDPTVWIDAIGRHIERDEDGTYFVRLD